MRAAVQGLVRDSLRSHTALWVLVDSTPGNGGIGTTCGGVEQLGLTHTETRRDMWWTT